MAKTMTKFFGLKITPEMDQELQKAGDKQRRTKAFIVREAITQFLGDKNDLKS